MNKIPSYQHIQEVRLKFFEMIQERWEANVVFTWRWWLLVILSFLPWVIWWKLVDRKNALTILFYGMIIIIANLILDNIGTDMLWWGYPYKIAPFFPPLFTPDFTIVPVLMMLVYQWFRTYKSFLIANFVLSIVIAFIGEPLFMWAGFYELGSWKLVYSFMYYNLIGLFAKWFTEFLANLKHSYDNPSSKV